MKATDLMHTDVRFLPPEMTLSEAERLLVEAKISGAPVISKGHLVGVLSSTDIVRQVEVGRAHAEEALDYYRCVGSFSTLWKSYDEEEREHLAESMGDRLLTVTVADAMTRRLVTVDPHADVSEVARCMIEHDVHRILVTEGSELRGLISSMDLVRHIAETAQPEAR